MSGPIALIRFDRLIVIFAKIVSVVTKNELKLLVIYSTGERTVFGAVPKVP